MLTLNTLFEKLLPETQEVVLLLDGGCLKGSVEDLSLFMNEMFMKAEVTGLEAISGCELKVWATCVNVEE